MSYGAVLFDAAETLFTTRESIGEIYASVARRFGSTASAAEIHEAFVRQFQGAGPLSSGTERQWWHDLVHRVLSEVGMIEDFEGFFSEVYDLFRDARGWMLFPETRSVLTELRQNAVRIGIVSNFDSRLYSVLDALGIRAFFDCVTICSETGYAKPQPEIFLRASRTLAVPPEQILYVGDSLVDDYQGGEAAGLHTLLIDRAGRYAEMRSIRRIDSLRALPSLLAGTSK